MKIKQLKEIVTNRQLDDIFRQLYVDDSLLDHQYTRYQIALQAYEKYFGEDDCVLVSSSGRTEVCGNHTDHQHGNVVAASLNLDAIAVAAPCKDVIEVVSEEERYPVIYLDQLEKKDAEEGTSIALIKGVIARLKELGYSIGGFKAYVTSEVLIGSGMSSSACFEVLMGTIISCLYNEGTIEPVTLAKVGQYSENVYFGKPCGLMDQVACSVGGLVTIDFEDTEKPIVEKINVDFASFHSSLCIIDTKGSHADLTEEYAAVPKEMLDVARYFHKSVLREVDPEDFYQNVAEIRRNLDDRSVLRAFHFFNEQKRVQRLIAALKAENYGEFKEVIKESGNSSYKYLQNVYANSDYQNQSVAIGLAFSEEILNGHGVCRVHGGGFSGTIQAFIDDDYVEEYKQKMEKIFGENTCHVLKIRDISTTRVI